MTSAVLRPAGNTPPATQDTVGHLYPMGTLLAYIQLLVGTVRFTAVFYLVSSQHILVHALLTTGLHPLPHHMSPHLSHYLVSPSSFCSCIDLPPPIHSQPPYSAHVSTVCIFSQISFFLFLNSWQFFLPPPPLDSDYSPASICHWFYLHSWLSPQEKQKLDPGCSYQKFAWMYLEERKRAAVWEKKGWCMIACIT